MHAVNRPVEVSCAATFDQAFMPICLPPINLSYHELMLSKIQINWFDWPPYTGQLYGFVDSKIKMPHRIKHDMTPFFQATCLY